MPPINHGTERGWRRCKGENGVACDKCRKAKQDAWERQRQKRLGKPIPEHLEHGMYVHYNYGCNCDVCMADLRAKKNKQKRIERARRREAHS